MQKCAHNATTMQPSLTDEFKLRKLHEWRELRSPRGHNATMRSQCKHAVTMQPYDHHAIMPTLCNHAVTMQPYDHKATMRSQCNHAVATQLRNQRNLPRHNETMPSQRNRAINNHNANMPSHRNHADTMQPCDHNTSLTKI
jgi:hypothetical protein